MKKFSVPYTNQVDSKTYLKFIEPYKDYLESVYIGIPEIVNHNSQFCADENTSSHDFLDDTKNGIVPYKRIVVCNAMFYKQHDSELAKHFENVVYPLIEKYKIDGFVVSSLFLAERLHKDFPKLELHTSCNSVVYNIRQMEYWRDVAGIEVFNPPREFCRKPKVLKEMADAGFKLKVLINEACLFDCPHFMNHCAHYANGTNRGYDCLDYKDDLIFKSNLFLPEWMPIIDDYVFCYKIAGRNLSLNTLKSFFDSYILRKKYSYIDEIANYSRYNIIQKMIDKGIRIKPTDIPLKVISCECKNCSTCTMCSDAMKRVYNRYNISEKDMKL